MLRLRALLPLPAAVGLLLGGAVACGGSGSGALPAVTATPTRSVSLPQPTRSAGVSPPATTAPTTAAPPTAAQTVVPPATTSARPSPTSQPTSQPTAPASSQAVVAPSPSTPAATATATTAPVSSTSDSGSSTGWWVLAIVLLAAAAGGISWVVVRHRHKWTQWRAAAAPVAKQTHVVISLIPVPPQRAPDPAQWQQVREQAEHNAQDLEAVAVSAPSDDATRATQGLARALRDEVSAVEALRLLEAAPSPPTGPELSEAEDVTRRARGDLDSSQARLDALIGAQPGASDPPLHR